MVYAIIFFYAYRDDMDIDGVVDEYIAVSRTNDFIQGISYFLKEACYN